MNVLKMAYCVGELAGMFAPGTLVLKWTDHRNKMRYTDYNNTNKPLNVLVTEVEPYWIERIPFDLSKDVQRPRRFGCRQEVLSAGGTTDWVGTLGTSDAVAPTFWRAAELSFVTSRGIKAAVRLERKSYLAQHKRIEDLFGNIKLMGPTKIQFITSWCSPAGAGPVAPYIALHERIPNVFESKYFCNKRQSAFLR